jgi:hypothetical protein
VALVAVREMRHVMPWSWSRLVVAWQAGPLMASGVGPTGCRRRSNPWPESKRSSSRQAPVGRRPVRVERLAAGQAPGPRVGCSRGRLDRCLAAGNRSGARGVGRTTGCRSRGRPDLWVGEPRVGSSRGRRWTWAGPGRAVARIYRPTAAPARHAGQHDWVGWAWWVAKGIPDRNPVAGSTEERAQGGE